METIMTLEEALERIAELEKENAKLKEEVEYYKNRKASGRQKHNAKWMAIYNDFVVCYEGGMTMVEIAKRNIIKMLNMDGIGMNQGLHYLCLETMEK